MMHNGLNLLDKEHRLPHKMPKMHLSKGLVYGPFFYLADKPGGIEPGFLGVEINDAFIRRVALAFGQSFTDSAACKAYLSNMAQEKLAPFVDKLLAEGQGKASTPSGHPPLKLLLFKQDYHEPTNLGVRPPLRRLKKTQALKAYPDALVRLYSLFRYRPTSKENTNAILETLANDVARAFGMPVQNQALVFGSYKNGDIKIMTACEWEPSLKMIEGELAGSKNHDDYDNHLIQHNERGDPISRPDGYYQSENSISNLGECLPLFISQGDRDVFGSKGQNKGRKANLLFGFDFGHAFRENNPIMHSLDDDFNFAQPRFKSEKFKNLSICYDTLMSERICGLFFIYKMMGDHSGLNTNEKAAIEAAILQYKNLVPGFSARYDQVVPNSYIPIFEAYHQKFITLAAEAKQASDSKAEAEFISYANKITAAQSYALVDNQKLLQIFKAKLQLGPQEVDLLANLSALSAETSPFSTDKKVALNHLRIVNNYGIHWELKKEGERFKLSAKVPPKILAETREKISTYLRQMQITDQTQHATDLHYTLTEAELKQWIAGFQEKNIRHFKITGATPLQANLLLDSSAHHDLTAKTKTLAQTQLLRVDELIKSLSLLTKQRQPKEHTEVFLAALLDDCKQIRAELIGNSGDDFSEFLKRTEEDLKLCIQIRMDLIESERIKEEIIGDPTAVPAKGESLFQRTPLLPEASLAHKQELELNLQNHKQQQMLSFKKVSLRERNVDLTLTDRERNSDLSLTKKSKNLDVAEILANALPDGFSELIQKQLRQDPLKRSLMQMVKDIIEHLKYRDGAITQQGLERVLKSLLKNQRDFNPSNLAEDLFKAYRRGTEQLDPYKDDGAANPYTSNHYLPNDYFIRTALHHVDSYVKKLASDEPIEISISKAWDYHYVEAVLLYCNKRGYTCTNDSGWAVNEDLLKEKSGYFNQLFELRYKDIPVTQSDSSIERNTTSNRVLPKTIRAQH